MCGKKQLRALQRRHAWRTFGENGSFDASVVVTCNVVTQKCKQVSIYRDISFLYFKRNSCRWQLIRGPNKSGTYFVYPSCVFTSFECATARLKSELTCNRLEPGKSQMPRETALDFHRCLFYSQSVCYFFIVTKK